MQTGSCSIVFRLEDTGMSQKGKNLLAEVCNSRENLDVNFLHHSQVLQKKNAKRVNWDLLVFVVLEADVVTVYIGNYSLFVVYVFLRHKFSLHFRRSKLRKERVNT